MTEPWWKTEEYSLDKAVPEEIEHWAGPHGVALVRVWLDGKTDPGWGLAKSERDKPYGFIEKYKRGAFRQAPIQHGFEFGRWNFAFVMRSLRLVCIDIDGKNGGHLHAGKLGMLPYTLAETSKSGDGLHLFYAVSEDVWKEEEGFAKFSDRIGLEQGVDLRATGCVFHYPQQRWNSRPVVELPEHLKQRLAQHSQAIDAQIVQIQKLLQSPDNADVLLVMRDTLIKDLAKPIVAGRRNNTLFAIGSQMCQAQIPDWEQMVKDRAHAVGLDRQEINKLIDNIQKYGVKP